MRHLTFYSAEESKIQGADSKTKAEQIATSEHTQWLESLTIASSSALYIGDFGEQVVFGAEPCMTTEVHGALIEGFRAKDKDTSSAGPSTNVHRQV